MARRRVGIGSGAAIAIALTLWGAAHFWLHDPDPADIPALVQAEMLGR